MHPRRRMSVLMTLLGLLLCRQTFATSIRDDLNPAGEQDLYQIYNSMLNTYYTSSQQLFDYNGVPDLSDWFWESTCESGFVRVCIVRQEDGQTLGYRTLVQGGNVVQQTNVPFEDVCSSVEFKYPFTFYIGEGEDARWSSVDYGGQDHFVAFPITGYIESSADLVYLIAFEDQDLLTGDRDYQDLIAIVECARPIPEPATMLLLGAGGMGLAALRRRRAV